MYQKLTYGGTECNSYLYFAFYADCFDVNLVTEKLHLMPTSVRIKQEPIPVSTSWNYRVDAGNEVDLVTFINKLIDVFDPKIEEILHIKKELNLKTVLQFVIYIDIDPETSTPFFGFNDRVIHFLAQTRTEVDFDIYKADRLGLLEEEQ